MSNNLEFKVSIQDIKPIKVANKDNKINKNKDIVFTDDQKKATDGIIEFLNNEFDEQKYAIGLIGAGGTGKTFVTNYIIENCKYANSTIKCTSPTHKACRVFSKAINGKHVYTIQSVLGLRLNLNIENFDPRRPQFDPKSSHKLDNTEILIVDEASMLPSKLVRYILKVCKELSVKVLFIGDSFQLPPVGERKSSAFEICAKVYELTQIVRQESTNPITELLKMIRSDMDKGTNNFFNFILTNRDYSNVNEVNKGFYICNSNEFMTNVVDNFSDEDFFKNIDLYKVIAYTNKCVASWNKFIRSKIIKDFDKSIITKNDLLMSYTTQVNDFNEIVINNSEEYIVHEIVDYIDSIYKIKGFIIRFQMVNGGTITDPLFIIDPTDRFSLDIYNKTVNMLESDAKNATAGKSMKWKEYYKFKNKYLLPLNILDRTGAVIQQRDLDYGFAITSHKSQGSTYNKVFVDMYDMIYDSNGSIYKNRDELLRRIYVACSRARNQLIIKL